MKKAVLIFLSISLCFLNNSLNNLKAQTLPSPKDFYGFEMGTDGELAKWDKIIEYFNILAEQSDRVIVQDLGKTTLGNPFILAIFSSAENLNNLEKYRNINKQLADPRGLSEEEINTLIKEGKYISAQSYSLHSTEVGGTQCVSELAYELVTSETPEIELIRENTIFLMFPCFNPDGHIMVTDWYYKYKGTEYQNKRLPYLYHYYTGHDDNRDSYQLTQEESRMFAEVVYRDWVPESYVDHHHFGGSGARFYIPPYLDPIHPNVDPLIWREHQLYGAHMAVALENAGKSGFETGAPFTGWWQASFHMSTNYHNITGMLTESASASLADPVYILPDQLGGTRGRPDYKPQMTMPRLWEGGWWSLRDIVEQQIISSKAVLELGARYKETMLRNMVSKATDNIKRGKNEAPYAFVIPKDQHDFLTATKLIEIFQKNGVEVHKLDKTYNVGTKVFAPGSYVISCAQPMRAFVVSFLEQVNYPDNPWTRQHGNQDPIRPYDLAGYSVSEHMGVDAIPITEPLIDISISKVENFVLPLKGTVFGSGEFGYLVEHRFNESFRAMNRIYKSGNGQIYWSKEGFFNAGQYFPEGTMIFEVKPEVANKLAENLGLNFTSLEKKFSGEKLEINKPEVGLYKRFAGGNSDEGWTSWLLKDFEFDFNIAYNKDIKDNDLYKNYDVLIIPSDGYQRIFLGDTSKRVPIEYRGGIGSEGVKNIIKFVKEGGTLITLNQAYDFAREVFGLPIYNTLDEIPSSEFYCPGSTVKIDVDNTHPVAYGVKSNSIGLFRRSPALRVRSGEFEDKVRIPVRYAEENILQSGWLIGEEYLSDKPYIVEFDVGKGKVLILASPVQHRAQTHGTFKFLFNSIFY